MDRGAWRVVHGVAEELEMTEHTTRWPHGTDQHTETAIRRYDLTGMLKVEKNLGVVDFILPPRPVPDEVPEAQND